MMVLQWRQNACVSKYWKCRVQVVEIRLRQDLGSLSAENSNVYLHQPPTIFIEADACVFLHSTSSHICYYSGMLACQSCEKALDLLPEVSRLRQALRSLKVCKLLIPGRHPTIRLRYVVPSVAVMFVLRTIAITNGYELPTDTGLTPTHTMQIETTRSPQQLGQHVRVLSANHTFMHKLENIPVSGTRSVQ